MVRPRSRHTPCLADLRVGVRRAVPNSASCNPTPRAASRLRSRAYSRSDRTEDYRTEVLGLVKAQQVKNSIIVPVGAKGGFLPKWLLGKHYRSTWTVPVNIPFLDLETQKKGLTVYEKGGGRQTTSLKMKGTDRREYVFRSVDKHPTRVLDVGLRETIVAKVLQDATSMQHPYGAMAISTLLDSTNILHAKPK